MEKLKMSSSNIVNENIEFIASRFPNALVEAKDDNGNITKMIDFDILKQELSSIVVDGDKERYTFVWPDKKQAILTANAPIAKTLRPCKAESVGKDGTNGGFDSEHLYIEGDNLDVLKLLRETYLGKVKMIYIDPPYNTGNDFVYNDDFATDTEDYLLRSNQIDEEGNRMVANNDSNGRFHTDWLNMIYPRLRLARDLLSDDGVIFISIDDNEYENLKKICCQIFSSSNFIADMIWQKKTGSSDANNIATITEFVLVFAKDINKIRLAKNTEAHEDERYKYSDEWIETRGRFYYDSLDRGTLGYHESLDYGVLAPDGTLVFPNGRTQQTNDGWRWKWGKEKLEWGIKNGFIELQKNDKKQCGWGVYYKIYKNVDNEGQIIERSSPFKNIITGVLNTNAANEAKQLFGRTDYFSNPKPVNLIKFLLNLAVKEDKNSIILDFFSGSATTAHAVMQLNAEDNGKRKFIMVQLPEQCDEKSEAYKAGYKNICEIGKERIRRAGKKIKQDNPLTTQNLDTGFRVLKLDSSCMKDVYYNPFDIKQDLLSQFENNIKEDRSPEDLLFQVMLEMGVLLSSEIKTFELNGKTVFNVNDGNLICCFDSDLTDDVVTEIAKMQPLYAVFRDSSFNTDSVAVNFDQIFETYSPTTTRKVI